MSSLRNKSKPWKLKELFKSCPGQIKLIHFLKGQTNHLFLPPLLLIAGRGPQTWSDFSKYVFRLRSNSNETVRGFVHDGGINFCICALDVKHECLRKLFLG